MADDTDTPSTGPTAAGDTNAAPRRRAPRKTSASAPTKRRAAATSKVEQAEATVKAAATRVKRSAAKAEGAVIDAVKSAKPRSGGRPKNAAATRRKAPAKSAAKSGTKTGKWGVAAIAGGLAAAGAAAAALFSLKGSTAKTTTPADSSKGAHQPDGADASKSFQAGIADENTVPN